MLPRLGAGPALLSVIASGGQGQLSRPSDLRASSHTSSGPDGWGRRDTYCFFRVCYSNFYTFYVTSSFSLVVFNILFFLYAYILISMYQGEFLF